MNSLTVPVLQLRRPAEWRAGLALEIASGPRGSRLVHSRHHGPLYVQKPFYPEGSDLAHIYLLHPPGGLVSGDRLDIEVVARTDARTLLTTPGAGRAYRARADQARQIQRTRLRLAAGASIEWLPQETIIFPGAQAHLMTRVDLSQGSHYLGWEMTCLGLPADGQPFDRGRLDQALEINLDGRPLLRDRFALGDHNRHLGAARVGLQACSVHGLLVAGPLPAATDAEALLDSLRAAVAGPPAASMTAITRIGDLVVGRFLGHSAQRGRQQFLRLWELLRPALLGRPACPPRIWAT